VIRVFSAFLFLLSFLVSLFGVFLYKLDFLLLLRTFCCRNSERMITRESNIRYSPEMNGAEQLHFVCQFDLRLINRINGDITQTEDVV